MKKLLFLGFILFTLGLNAQYLESQVNYVATASYSQPWDIYDVLSDGNLYFFHSVAGTSNLTVSRTKISSTGTVSAPQTIFTYNNGTPWGNNVPYIYRSWCVNNISYLYLANSTHHFIVKIPDIAANTLPSMHVFSRIYPFGENCQLGENKIYQIVDTGSPDFLKQVNCLDLSDNTQSIVIPPIDADYQPRMACLGFDNLLVYESGIPALSRYKLIDMQGNVSALNVVSDEPGYITSIYRYNTGIGEGIYAVNFYDAQNTETASGYVSLQGNQLDIVILEGHSNVTPLPWHIHSSIVTLGNQRIICKDRELDSDQDDHFVTYQFTDGHFVETTDFPNLNSPMYYNAKSLFRLSDRYIIGVSEQAPGQRRFACIDLERQTIKTTLYSMLPGTTTSDYSLSFGGRNLFFQNFSGNDEIMIYTVVDATGNTDEVATATPLSVSVSPNPFFNNTTIKVGNASDAASEISIYNLKGQKVKSLCDLTKTENDILVNWDGRDMDGKSLPAGMYLYKVKASSRTTTGKLIKVQ